MTVASWTLLLLLWVGAFIALIYLRNAALSDAETQISNLTRVMAAQSEVVFHGAEAILLDAREIVEESDHFQRAKMEHLLNSKAASVPSLRSVAVFDADGHLLHLSNLPDPGPDFSVTDRAWFNATRDTPTRGIVVSAPLHGRIHPEGWMIPVSLRIEGPDHSFRGAVLAALDPAFFGALFKDLDLGPGSAIALQRADSTVLARRPFDIAVVGRAFPEGKVYAMMRNSRAGVTRGRSVVDGDIRLLGGRMLDSFPAYVSITRTETSILGVWRTQMLITISSVMMISLLLFAVMRQSDTAARLAAKNEAVHALIDASPRPMATLRRTPAGGFAVEWANLHFADLLRLALDEILDRPLLPLLARVSSSPLPNGIDDPRGSRFEIRLKSTSEPTVTQMLFTPVQGRAGAFDLILVTAVDLTAKQAAARKEAERHLLEALGRMAGRIAHEINNVLQPILSHCSLALHASPGNEEAAAHLREIQNGVRSGRDIVRSVLTLAGGKAVAREPRALDVELSAAIDLIRPSVPDHIALSVERRASGAMVLLAPGEMFQILSNLIGNAVDATPNDGHIRITLDPRDVDLIESAVLDITPGAYWQLQVSDDGSGMDHEVASRALEPFFTTKPFGRGAGLGLSTVQSVVSALNGSLGLSSSPGKGATIRILFPSA